jgi:RimJ/RimL family protein N-acetyltransferase
VTDSPTAAPRQTSLPPAPLLPRRTDRLVLRPLRPGDEQDLLAYRSRADVCRYIPSEPLTEATATDFITERMELTRITKDADRLILAVELAGQVIGDLLVRGGAAQDRQTEIGWVLSPDFQGHGYATEAAQELIRLSFTDLDMHRVWAQLDPRNTASAKLCERIGMLQEAHLRESMWFKGEWSDTVIYGILRSEWQDDRRQDDRRQHDRRQA